MNFEFIKVLGNGNFSDVFLIEKENRYYALKRIEKIYEEFGYAEIDLLRNINHKNIIQYENHIIDENFIYIVLEYFDGQILSYNTQYDSIKTILDLSETLIYLHNKGYVHGDLALDNVLIDKNGNIKLIDFGLCKAKISGQLLFCAPEMLSNNERSKATDIWALGVIAFFLLTGTYPYKGSDKNTMLIRTMNQKIKYSKYNLGKHIKKFFKNVFNKTPSKRLLNIKYLLD